MESDRKLAARAIRVAATSVPARRRGTVARVKAVADWLFFDLHPVVCIASAIMLGAAVPLVCMLLESW